MSHWSLDFTFKTKLILDSGNQKIQYSCQATVFKVVALKINWFLSIETKNICMKFITEIPKETLETMPPNPETKRSNMAAKQPFWKWHQKKLIGFYPHTQVMCYWSLVLIFKAKVRSCRKQKIQYGCQAAILKSWNIAENQQVYIHTHQQCSTEACNWYSKPN